MDLIYKFINHLFEPYELDDKNLLLRNDLGQKIYDLLMSNNLEISKPNILKIYDMLGGDNFLLKEYVYPNDLIRFDKSDIKRIVNYNFVGLFGILFTVAVMVIYLLLLAFSNMQAFATKKFFDFIPVSYSMLLFVFPIVRGVLILLTMTFILKYRKKLSSYHQLLITISVSFLASIYGIGMLVYSIIKIKKLSKSFNIRHYVLLFLVAIVSLGITVGLNNERRTFYAFDLSEDYGRREYRSVFDEIFISELEIDSDLNEYIDISNSHIYVVSSDQYIYQVNISDVYLTDFTDIDIMSNSIVAASILVNEVDICDSPKEFSFTDTILGNGNLDCEMTYEIDGPGFDKLSKLNETGINVQFKVEYTNDSNQQVVLILDCVTIDNIYDYEFVRK